MSYNQDLNGGNPLSRATNPNIQTIPNSGFNQGFSNSNVQGQQSSGLGQFNTDTTQQPAYDSVQQSSGLGSSGGAYNQTSSYGNSGLNSTGNYDTTQTSHVGTGGSSNTGLSGSQQQQGYYGTNQDSYANSTGDSYLQQTQGSARKASTGDKIKGNLEKLAGKISGDPYKVAHGEDLTQGRVLE